MAGAEAGVEVQGRLCAAGGESAAHRWSRRALVWKALGNGLLSTNAICRMPLVLGCAERHVALPGEQSEPFRSMLLPKDHKACGAEEETGPPWFGGAARGRVWCRAAGRVVVRAGARQPISPPRQFLGRSLRRAGRCEAPPRGLSCRQCAEPARSPYEYATGTAGFARRCGAVRHDSRRASAPRRRSSSFPPGSPTTLAASAPLPPRGPPRLSLSRPRPPRFPAGALRGTEHPDARSAPTEPLAWIVASPLQRWRALRQPSARNLGATRLVRAARAGGRSPRNAQRRADHSKGVQTGRAAGQNAGIPRTPHRNRALWSIVGVRGRWLRCDPIARGGGGAGGAEGRPWGGSGW